MRRITMSVPPTGVSETIQRMGLVGQIWAWVLALAIRNPQAMTKRTMPCMRFMMRFLAVPPVFLVSPKTRFLPGTILLRMRLRFFATARKTDRGFARRADRAANGANLPAVDAQG